MGVKWYQSSYAVRQVLIFRCIFISFLGIKTHWKIFCLLQMLQTLHCLWGISEEVETHEWPESIPKNCRLFLEGIRRVLVVLLKEEKRWRDEAQCFGTISQPAFHFIEVKRHSFSFSSGTWTYTFDFSPHKERGYVFQIYSPLGFQVAGPNILSSPMKTFELLMKAIILSKE